jgi:hypothetical protein
MDLRNVEFAVQDVTRLPPGSSFDLITAFDGCTINASRRWFSKEPAMR